MAVAGENLFPESGVSRVAETGVGVGQREGIAARLDEDVAVA